MVKWTASKHTPAVADTFHIPTGGGHTSGEYLSIINVSSWLQIVPRWFLCHIIAILLSYGFANKWFPNMNPNYESVIWQNIHTLSLRVWLLPFDDILQHFWSNLTKILFLTIYCFISCVSTRFLRDTAQHASLRFLLPSKLFL